MLVSVRKKHWLVMSISVTSVLLLLVFNVKVPTLHPAKYITGSSEIGFISRRIANDDKDLTGAAATLPTPAPQFEPTVKPDSEDHKEDLPHPTTPSYIHLSPEERVAYAKQGILMVGNDLPPDDKEKKDSQPRAPQPKATVEQKPQPLPVKSKDDWQRQIMLQRMEIQKKQKLLQEHHLKQQQLLQQQLQQEDAKADEIQKPVGLPAAVSHQSSSVSVVSKTAQVSQDLAGSNHPSGPSGFRRPYPLSGPYYYHPHVNYESLKTMGEKLARHTVKKEFSDAIRDSDFVPGDTVKPSQVRRVIILSTWRSGSSFLGDLLRSYPGTFFSFEPLHHLLKNQHLQEGPLVDTVINLIRGILTCNYHDQKDYVNYMRNNTFLIDHNTRLWNSCSRNRALCFDRDYVSKVCEYMPVNAIKTVRMGLSPLIQLLEDPSLDLRVIHLVRDPRGSMHSRMQLAWCRSMACSDPETVCNDLLTDLKLSKEVKERFPDRYLFVRYEDLSLEPEKKAQEIMSFLNLTYQKSVASFIRDHTSLVRKTKKKPGTYSTYRDSKANTFAWRSALNYTTVDGIQDFCKEPLDLLGLRHFQNEEEYMNATIPVLLS